MSIQRICKVCGLEENIRISFKTRDLEREYHSVSTCLGKETVMINCPKGNKP